MQGVHYTEHGIEVFGFQLRAANSFALNVSTIPCANFQDFSKKGKNIPAQCMTQLDASYKIKHALAQAELHPFISMVNMAAIHTS